MPNSFAEELALAEAMGDLSLTLRSLANPEGEASKEEPTLVQSFSKGGPQGTDNAVTMVRNGRSKISVGGK